MTVLLALRSCRTVHLYGFFPECCHPEHYWLDKMLYKYYHTERSAWVCCSAGREDMSRELRYFVAHPRIEVHHVALPKLDIGRPSCAVVGSAYRQAEYGDAIDAFAQVYRVNHAPAGNQFAAKVGRRTTVRTLGDGTLRFLLGDMNVNRSCEHCEHRIAGLDVANSSSLCAAGTRCVFVPNYGHRKRYFPQSTELLHRARAAKIRIEEVDPSFVARSLLLKAQFSQKQFYKVTLSGWMVTTLLALNECSSVHVFNMETRANQSCCHSNMPYTYYSKPESNSKCCVPSSETKDEYRVWAALQAVPSLVIHD